MLRRGNFCAACAALALVGAQAMAVRVARAVTVSAVARISRRLEEMEMTGGW